MGSVPYVRAVQPLDIGGEICEPFGLHFPFLDWVLTVPDMDALLTFSNWNCKSKFTSNRKYGTPIQIMYKNEMHFHSIDDDSNSAARFHMLRKSYHADVSFS